MVKKQLSLLGKSRIVNAISRTVGRRNHAEKRLKERFGLDYVKVRNVIDNGGSKMALECRNGNKIYYLPYMGQEIYFSIFRGEIKTFLTKEMVEKNFPEIFDPPKEAEPKKKKQKRGKRGKRRQQELIPASKLFKRK